MSDLEARLVALERRVALSERTLASRLHAFHARGELPENAELACEIQRLHDRLVALASAMDATIPSASVPDVADWGG